MKETLTEIIVVLILAALFIFAMIKWAPTRQGNIPLETYEKNTQVQH